MTHGSTSPWKPQALHLHLKTKFRLPFIALGLLILVVTLLSASYYSSIPVIRQFNAFEYETFRNACVQRTNSSANNTVLKARSHRKLSRNRTDFLWNDTRLDIMHMVGLITGTCSQVK